MEMCNKMKAKEITSIAMTLVTLGIIFGSDRLIGYSFIGAGVILSLVSLIQSKKERKKEWGTL